MTTGVIVIVIVGLLLIVLKVLLDRSIKVERTKNSGKNELMPSNIDFEDRVEKAIENGELRISRGALHIEIDAKPIWAKLDPQVRNLLQRYGEISWESGGYIGRRISANLPKQHSNLLANQPDGLNWLLIGSDEAEIFTANTSENKIYCINVLLNRVDVYSDIYELISDSAGLEDSQFSD